MRIARFGSALFLLAVVSVPAAAQADGGTIAMRDQWRGATNYILRAAEQMPEADYAYKPVANVRTFGELVGHVAGAQAMICAAALGEPQPAEDAVEKAAKTKDALIAALKKSMDYCTRAYGIGPADAAKTTNLFGSSMSRYSALALNAVHNGEHYGNIVTYMRMKGMVPPSSQPSR